MATFCTSYCLRNSAYLANFLLAIGLSLLFIQSFQGMAWAAPTLTATHPAAGATWVSELSTFTATFSEPINSATVTARSFTLARHEGVVAVAAAAFHTMAIHGDGTFVAWGSNEFGQATVPTGLAPVTAIAGGFDHSLALQANGIVVAWGNDNFGKTSVPPGLDQVVAVAAGAHHSVALRQDGTVVAWGENEMGQISVPPGLSGVTAIAAGGYHTVALKGDGTVVAWGENYSGQTAVPAGLSGVCAIAGGYDFTVALKDDGSVVVWGDNGVGQATVPAGLSGVVAIAAGYDHVLALQVDGKVVAWGGNYVGQSTVPEGLSGVVAIAASWQHTVVLKSDGTLVAWGKNDTGQAAVPAAPSGVVAIAVEDVETIVLQGDGTVSNWGQYSEFYQTTAQERLTGVVAIAAGNEHAVALKGDGTLVTWGGGFRFAPWIPEGLSGVMDVDAGYHHTLALKNDGTVVNWGTVPFGANPGLFEVPVGLAGVIAVAAGNYHSMALKGDGTVVTWGDNTYGQTDVPDGLADVAAIAAGGSHSVALRRDGTLISWGNNAYGQATVPDGLADVAAIAAGGSHSVAIRRDGTVVTWGDNTYGQATVPDGLADVAAIAAGGARTAAIRKDGSVITWGKGGHYVPASPYLVPVPATVGYDPNGRTATLTPLAPLEPDAAYRATVFAHSTTGVPMAGSQTWDIYTAGTAVEVPGDIRVPLSDNDGSYVLSWEPSATAGVNYVVVESTDPAFFANLRPLYVGTARQVEVTAPENGAYYYRVKALKYGLSDSAWRSGGNPCLVTVPEPPTDETVLPPSSINVPVLEPDGCYRVKWAASSTRGARYVLEEATDPGFTANLRTAYTGVRTGTRISGRSAGSTYYYRVKTTRSGHEDSRWLTAVNGCSVPYLVKTRAGRGGRITPAGTVVIPVGSTQLFTISPKTGYHTISVTVDRVGKGAVDAVTGPDEFDPVVRAHSIVARFAINRYSVSTSTGPGGIIRPAGTRFYNHGRVVSFRFSPNDGYRIGSILVNGQEQGSLPLHGACRLKLRITERTMVAATFVPED